MRTSYQAHMNPQTLVADTLIAYPPAAETENEKPHSQDTSR
jgi:hypothetical protein